MKTLKRDMLLILIFLFSFSGLPMQAQVLIENGQVVTQNFDTIGTSAIATLPTGWRVDKINDHVRTVGTYANASTETERRAGDNMPGNATNGIYNFGAGDMTTATDRAIGWISSGSATKSGNLYVKLENAGSANINYFTISYDVEKYRQGTRLEGFSIQMYYSLDGVSWTDAGSDFLTSFAGGDTANLGYASAPGEVVAVTAENLDIIIPQGGSLYLAWNYSVTSGTFTSNAQALGIDNVVIQAADASTTNDATLSSISLSEGFLVPSFSPGVFSYTVELPFGTTATPSVTATPSAPEASVTVTPAIDVTSTDIAERTTSIEVISEDSTVTNTYDVVFNVPATASNDATLSSITTSIGTLSPSFDPAVFYYTVQMPYGTTVTPTVDAISTYPFASVTITPAIDINSSDSIERTTTIVVVAEDNVTTETYLVQFNPTILIYTDVSDIEELRSGATDGTLYRLTGEAVITYTQSNRNQKFIQDATAGMMIDDLPHVLSTAYEIGDGITNLIGSLYLHNNMLQFRPEVDPGPSSVNNIIVPEVKTVSQINSDEQGRLVKIENASFTSSPGAFQLFTSYDLTDATGTIVFRTSFSEADYIGTTIPNYEVDVVGIVHQYINTINFTARFLSDITHATSVLTADKSYYKFKAYPNPSADYINFKLELPSTQNVVLKVYDNNSRLVFEYASTLSNGLHHIKWDEAAMYPAGVYYYSLIIDERIKNGKLIITQ